MYVKKEQALKNRYEFCCSKMKENVLVMQGMTMTGKANHTVFFSIDFNEFDLRSQKNGYFVPISFCPWCGKPLPGGLREKWTREKLLEGIDLSTVKLPEPPEKRAHEKKGNGGFKL